MILKNESDKNIENYRIEECTMVDGKVVVLPDGSYQKTGKTLEWSIGAGETLEFPDYVGEYLQHIYGFLKNVEPEVKEEKVSMPVNDAPPSTAVPSGQTIGCKICGKRFKNTRALGLHFGSAHPGEIGA